MTIHSLMRILLVATFCLLLAGTAIAAEALPRLVDVGSDTCVPCKMMAPILDELKTAYAGRMSVVFVDAKKDPETARNFGVRMIPTQIFYGRDGKELFRHTGFYGRDEILGKWRELGYDFSR